MHYRNGTGKADFHELMHASVSAADLQTHYWQMRNKKAGTIP